MSHACNRQVGWILASLLAAGCQPVPTPPADPPLVGVRDFASWPKATKEPIRVGPDVWAMCRSATPDEDKARASEAAAHGPHASRSILVRVKPDAIDAYLAGKPLPTGAVVVKEKYQGEEASGTLRAFALMTKREAGYDPAGGDWEYAYATLDPERSVKRGRLAECAGCHASAKGRDYLFRSYGPLEK